jgi:hypothetical protein
MGQKKYNDEQTQQRIRKLFNLFGTIETNSTSSRIET